VIRLGRTGRLSDGARARLVVVKGMSAHVRTERNHCHLVCLNTVAILFMSMCDIDNIFFDLALGERVRARVGDAGRVELDYAEATALARTKAVHVVLIVLSLLGAVTCGDRGALTRRPSSSRTRGSRSCWAAWQRRSCRARARRRRRSASTRWQGRRTFWGRFISS
jgi:hypothetical protein